MILILLKFAVDTAINHKLHEYLFYCKVNKMYKKNMYYLGIWPVPGCTISVGGLDVASEEIELDIEDPVMVLLKSKISCAINLQSKSLLKASSSNNLK